MEQLFDRTLLTGDNLPILRAMESQRVDLIYLDPPFNSGRRYSAVAGSAAAGAEFDDRWGEQDLSLEWLREIATCNSALLQAIEAVGAIGGASDKAYLIYMAIRVLELHRVLKDSGSLYFHCDTTMSHGIKLMLDAIFKKENFLNEIIWHYTGGGRSKRHFSRKHDSIFWYRKSQEYRFDLDAIRVPYSPSSGYARGGMRAKSGLHYMPHARGKPIEDVWYIPIVNPMAKERVGYPTQKPLLLLRRIIEASSSKGDLVLDPFCGSATTCVAAEQLHRRWIGIDSNPKAKALLQVRLQREQDFHHSQIAS